MGFSVVCGFFMGFHKVFTMNMKWEFVCDFLWGKSDATLMWIKSENHGINHGIWRWMGWIEIPFCGVKMESHEPRYRAELILQHLRLRLGVCHFCHFLQAGAPMEWGNLRRTYTDSWGCVRCHRDAAAPTVRQWWLWSGRTGLFQALLPLPPFQTLHSEHHIVHLGPQVGNAGDRGHLFFATSLRQIQ